MIDENLWQQLSDDEKLEQLEKYLTDFRLLDSGVSEYYGTPMQGKIKTLKTELKKKIHKIIELEHVI
jgi:hypothetical protein